MDYLVTMQDAGRTIKSILKNNLLLSSTAVARLVRQEGGILRNGQPARTIDTVSPGDVVAVSMGEPLPLVAQNCPIPVIWEDGYLLVLNKPAHMAVHHSTLTPETPTVERVITALGLPFHPVNRLDKGTTGLMVVAKSGYVHNLLRQTLHGDGFQRSYLALCEGCPTPLKGRIDAPIAREEGSVLKRCVSPQGAQAVSDYQVMSTRGNHSSVLLRPETGRTHQLRVHMAHMGHPLLGDWLYGTERQELITRPALHSAQLNMVHPITHERLHFQAPLPQDMALYADATVSCQNLPCEKGGVF